MGSVSVRRSGGKVMFGRRLEAPPLPPFGMNDGNAEHVGVLG